MSGGRLSGGLKSGGRLSGGRLSYDRSSMPTRVLVLLYLRYRIENVIALARQKELIAITTASDTNISLGIVFRFEDSRIKLLTSFTNYV